MLKSLTIKNYALIKGLEMDPARGLNIVTGETGAGKSIMIGAVGLLLGNRADTKVLYDENEKCVIEGAFDIEAYGLSDFFHGKDLDYSQQTIIRREISPSGKSRAFVNDTPVTLDVLKELGGFLMDIHSQHDTLALASTDYQLSILDAYAGLQRMLSDYKTVFASYKKAEKTYRQLLAESEAIKKEANYHQFLLDELVKADLQEQEQEEMEKELQVLEHSEEIKRKLTEASEILSRSEFNVIAALHEANLLLSQIKEYSDVYSGHSDRMGSCLIELKDLAAEIEREADITEFDPARAEQIKERLSLIYQLQQKHRVDSIPALLEIRDDLEEKVNKAINLDDELAALKNELNNREKVLMQKAGELSDHRKEAFPRFVAEMERLVRDLGMPHASLAVQHKTCSPTASGVDDIAILFSANKGVAPQELKAVASGGEFSRLMFCVKYLLADKTALPTIVFDEVDAGISGEIALKMARMMRQMSGNHQALVITHLPQIAAKGEKHYFVYKDNQSEKTVSKIKALSESERIHEIAKMLGGENPSAVALENARELIGED